MPLPSFCLYKLFFGSFEKIDLNRTEILSVYKFFTNDTSFKLKEKKVGSFVPVPTTHLSNFKEENVDNNVFEIREKLLSKKTGDNPFKIVIL